MNLIPLICIKKKKLYENNTNQITIKDIKNSQKKITELYFIDYDGLEKNKPNFSTYQTLASHCTIWVDFGPRSLGDIVDIVMAGAEKIIFRKNLCPNIDTPSIRNVIDSQMYEYYNNKYDTNTPLEPISSDIDGVVIQGDETENKHQKINEYAIEGLVKKYPTYVIEQEEQKFSYWKRKQISSIITDFSTWKKEKNHD